MKPSDEAALKEKGCLVVGGVILASLVAGFIVNYNFLWGAATLVLIWIGFCMVLNRRDKLRAQEALQDAFSSLDVVPLLQQTFSYGFPHFTLTFRNKRERDHAEDLGYIDCFRSSIQELFNHCGDDNRPFDAEIAVFATYTGWEPKVFEVSSSNAEQAGGE